MNYEKLQSGIYTIAEMSANHAGSLENALAIVHAAKKAGADCLKIQTYTADSITLDCDNEYFKIKGGLWDGYILHELYKEAATPYEWQPIIKTECDKIGIDFLSTPFDKAAVDFLEELGVTAYKIASFELVDIPLIEYTASKGKPLFISCGMGSVEEIEEAVAACRSVGNEEIVLLKCTSEYPVNPADMNLATIPDMLHRFGLPVGLSDHSIGSTAAVCAVSLGAVVIEKHFCLDRAIKNPDSEFSSEPAEFERLVQGVKQAAQMRGGVFYGACGAEISSTVFRRSLFAAKNIKKGDIITTENIRSVRPGNGIKPKYLNQLLGTKAVKDMSFGEPVGEEWAKSYEAIHLDCQLRKALETDCELLLEWANEKETREYSFNPELISFETHSKWFKKNLDSDKSLIHIFCKNRVPLGQVRLDFVGGKAVIDYSVSKNHRGNGYATSMLREAEKIIIEHYPEITLLEGTIKHDNFASNRVFEKLSYKMKKEGETIVFTKNI